MVLPITSFANGHEPKLDQRVMKFVGIIDVRPYFAANSLDCPQIERAKIRSRFGIEPSPLKHSPSPSLFKRRVVEKRIRPRVQNFLRERGCFNNVTGDQSFFAALDRSEQRLEAFDVHRFFETIANSLSNQRMIWYFDVAAGQVLGTSDLIRKDGR